MILTKITAQVPASLKTSFSLLDAEVGAGDIVLNMDVMDVTQKAYARAEATATAPTTATFSWPSDPLWPPPHGPLSPLWPPPHGPLHPRWPPLWHLPPAPL